MVTTCGTKENLQEALVSRGMEAFLSGSPECWQVPRRSWTRQAMFPVCVHLQQDSGFSVQRRKMREGISRMNKQVN